ncbi:hypothetical protein GCM10027443_00530 [Pontibacter brevis]
MQKTTSLEPGKYYHLYTRSNNKETLFRHPDNYAYFLQLYRKYIAPYADTFAYCLLPDRVHFLIRIKEEEALKPLTLSEDPTKLISVPRQLAHLLNAYAKTINNRYDRVGRLFQHRFGRKEVTSEAYFTRLSIIFISTHSITVCLMISAIGPTLLTTASFLKVKQLCNGKMCWSGLEEENITKLSTKKTPPTSPSSPHS